MTAATEITQFTALIDSKSAWPCRFWVNVTGVCYLSGMVFVACRGLAKKRMD
jgi:hypothetical protein